jgi:hypothetical protein
MLISMLLDRKNHAVLRALLDLDSTSDASEVYSSVVSKHCCCFIPSDLFLGGASSGGRGRADGGVLRTRVAARNRGDDGSKHALQRLLCLRKNKHVCCFLSMLFFFFDPKVLLFAELLKRPPVRSWLVSVLRKPVTRSASSPSRIAASVLARMAKCAPRVPPILAHVLLRLSESAATRFPAFRHTVVTTFVLLRAIGPLLLTPAPLLVAETPRPHVQSLRTAALRLLLAKANAQEKDAKEYDQEANKKEKETEREVL